MRKNVINFDANNFDDVIIFWWHQQNLQKMSPKSSKFHKKLLKTEYRKILRLFVADITEFPEEIYLEKFKPISKMVVIYRPEFSGKNKDPIVSWDLEVVTTWNFHKELHSTKQVYWWHHFSIFADVSKNAFWSVKYTWVINQHLLSNAIDHASFNCFGYYEKHCVNG